MDEVVRDVDIDGVSTDGDTDEVMTDGVDRSNLQGSITGSCRCPDSGRTQICMDRAH